MHVVHGPSISAFIGTLPVSCSRLSMSKMCLGDVDRIVSSELGLLTCRTIKRAVNELHVTAEEEVRQAEPNRNVGSAPPLPPSMKQCVDQSLPLCCQFL